MLWHHSIVCWIFTPSFCEMFSSHSFKCKHFQCIPITTQRKSIAPSCYAQSTVTDNTRYHQCGYSNHCQTNLYVLREEQNTYKYEIRRKPTEKRETVSKMHSKPNSAKVQCNLCSVWSKTLLVIFVCLQSYIHMNDMAFYENSLLFKHTDRKFTAFYA